MNRRQHIVLAGAGGNTGSHLVPHLARMGEIARLTLADPDHYDVPTNLHAQNIDRFDGNRAKVQVQAAMVSRINSEIAVVARAERIEDIPRGLLRCDLMVSCLDSKAARQHVNEIAFRLGAPWIDCGVLGSQNLARVNGYVPSSNAPCLECPWGSDEYALLEQEYLCAAGSGAARPTLATSALGALAASLVAIEIEKFLRGDLTNSAVGRQVVFDAQHCSLVVTQCRRNPQCLFDHRTWHIEPWRCRLDSTTLGDTLRALGSVQVEGHHFVSALVCPVCGRREDALRLNRPLAHCAGCGRRMVTPRFDTLDRLDSRLPAAHRDLTMKQAGLHADDVITAGDWHYQLKEAT